MVFLVPLSLSQFALFTLTVIDEGLDGGDQCEDAEAEPDGKQDTYKDCLKSSYGFLPPLA